jgi:hypothetical protein
MKQYLIIGHSQHTKDKFKLKENQYVIFSVRCGRFTYITENNALLYSNKRKLNDIVTKYIDSNNKHVYKPGQYVPNQLIQFSATKNENVFLKGAFELPLTNNLRNTFLTKGFNKNALHEWFINDDISYSYDLEYLLGGEPGIYFVHTCRGINGISFENSKIGILKQNGKIDYISKPRSKRTLNNSNTESLNTKNMLKSFKASTMSKGQMGSLRIAIKKAHRLMREENEVSSKTFNNLKTKK